jgi:tyrosyl-tRNA synthetase
MVLATDTLHEYTNNLKFIYGSEIQMTPDYISKLYKLTTEVNIAQCKKAGNEALKINDNPVVSKLLYPIMQVLDEEALKVDIQIGGINQRNIFTLSRDISDYVNRDKCCYLITQTVNKLHNNNEYRYIYFTDTFDTIKLKINKAICVEGQYENNPLLIILQFIIFPLIGQFDQHNTWESFITDWTDKKIDVSWFKALICVSIEEIIAPIRDKLH